MDKPQLFKESGATISRETVTYYLKKYVPKIHWNNDGGSVIDLGCCDGSVTSILKSYVPKNYKMYACDISPKMIDFAKQDPDHENTTFVLQDVQGELTDDLRGAFDNVFSFFLFHWISDQKKGFQNVYEMLKPGGECFHIFIVHMSIYTVYEVMSRTPKWSGLLCDVETFITPYQNVEKPDEKLTQLMNDIGFSSIYTEVTNTVQKKMSLTMHKKLIRAIDPNDMADNRFEDFYKDFITTSQNLGHFSEDVNEDGHQALNLYYRLIIVHANKPNHLVVQ